MTHGHDHSASKAIGTAFFLNLLFTIIEIVGGILTNSLAILSDALHDFGDVISLGISWYLEKVAKKPRSEQFSYGYSRFSLLGAILNALVLLVGSTLVTIQAIPRLMHPEISNAKGMIFIALIGITINGLAALKLKNNQSNNVKFVFFHMLEDVLSWVAILISAIVMSFVRIPVLDTILSLLIVIFIVYNVLKNLRKTLRIFLQSTPENINLEILKDKITKKFHSDDIHDIHLWTLDGEKNIFTAHILLKNNLNLDQLDQLKVQIKKYLKKQGIDHSTIEFEHNGSICEQVNC